jgi:hypothetical protein
MNCRQSLVNSASISRHRARQFLPANLLKRQKLNRRKPPHHGRRDPFVVVPQDVADAGDLPPGNFGVTRLELLVAAGLRNDLNPSLHKPLPLPIGLEGFQRDVADDAPNSVDRFDDIGQTWNRRTRR